MSSLHVRVWNVRNESSMNLSSLMQWVVFTAFVFQLVSLSPWKMYYFMHSRMCLLHSYWWAGAQAPKLNALPWRNHIMPLCWIQEEFKHINNNAYPVVFAYNGRDHFSPTKFCTSAHYNHWKTEKGTWISSRCHYTCLCRNWCSSTSTRCLSACIARNLTSTEQAWSRLLPAEEEEKHQYSLWSCCRSNWSWGSSASWTWGPSSFFFLHTCCTCWQGQEKRKTRIYLCWMWDY